MIEQSAKEPGWALIIKNAQSRYMYWGLSPMRCLDQPIINVYVTLSRVERGNLKNGLFEIVFPYRLEFSEE